MDKNAAALLDIPGLVELSAEETKETNGGSAIIAAFAIGFAIGCCINKIVRGRWL